jgi:NAD(P)-dependent dehydrogenase (short-subunit alcohol dehydrogenase family)
MDNALRHTRQPACIVAGAGPRLGLAIAERFAAEGFAAYPLSRTPERLSPHIAALRANGLTIWPMECDLADPDEIESALRRVRQRHGFCDVLVYNAFSAVDGEALEFEAEPLIDNLRVNLGGALEFVRKTLDGMRCAGGGAILFTGCSAATSGLSLRIGQACLRVLVDYLVPKLKQSGIRAGIVTVSPSIVDDAPYVRRAAQAYWEMFITSDRAYTHDVRVEC